MTAALAPVRMSELLRLARVRNASDIHVCPGAAPALRVDGALEVQHTLCPTVEEVASLAASVLGPQGLEALATDGDATVAHHVEHVGPIRVHGYRSAGATNLAIRLLAPSVPKLENLNLPPVVASFVQKPHGLVIFCGPTGCGKSTALAALVDRLNRTHARHVITIEDPIEYVHASDMCIVNQRELGRDVSSYDRAVYGALRSDPDVILIGEMRDPQTMHAALTAAETGHLVLTSLHTGDAPQTVDRIVGVFDGGRQNEVRTQLAQTLLGIVSLRLLPAASGAGRRAACEILIGTDAVRSTIRDGKTHQLRNIIATGRQCGMLTLESHLCELVARREISPEDARAAAARPDEMRLAERTPA